MKYQVVTANEWLYPDSQVSATGKREIALAGAREARMACQVLFEGVAPGVPISWSYRPDSKVGQSAWEQPEVYQLVDVAVTRNTGPVGFVVQEGESAAGYTTRPAPFRVYDALKRLGSGAQSRGKVEALYICWRIAHDGAPGHHSGKLTAAFGEEACSIPVTLDVFAASVPREGTLAVTNWFSVENMASRHQVAMWSEEHWAMIRRYAELMRRGRQNHFRMPLEVIEISKVGADEYRFDFSRAERFVRLFLELGFTHIEGHHVGTRVNFQDARFVLAADRSIQATSIEGYVFLAQYLGAWFKFLERNGWLGRALQYVGDEPIDNSAQDYRVLSGIVRKFLPGIPIVDAVERPGLAGAVDIWVPKTHYYQEHQAEFDLYRRFGDQIWCYTCCFPGGRHANRLLDMPLIRTRLLHWGNYLYDLVGYLHWGFNLYGREQNPFEETCLPIRGGGSCLPPGDTHIVYPGPNGPWGSVRFEAMGAGIEDYELLRLLEAKDKRRADEIVRRTLRAFDDMDESPANLAANHRELLQAL